MFVSLGCRKIVRRAAPKGLKKSDVVWALEKVVLSAVPYHSPPRYLQRPAPGRFPQTSPPTPGWPPAAGPPPSPQAFCGVPAGIESIESSGTKKGTGGVHRPVNLSLKYPTHYSFLFYTPYIIFIIVLCNTNYYRIHITFHYTLPNIAQPHHSYVFSYCSSVTLHLYLSMIYSTVY